MKTAYPFKFGTMIIEYEDDTVTGIICNPEGEKISEEDLKNRSDFSDRVMNQISEYLDGARKELNLKVEIKGTEFQKEVWKALTEIPYGETRSYGQIAEAIGNPKAVRAVGMANNKNPLLLFIPCHRVIGADGSMTGYAGGLEMKQYLLDLEKKYKNQ